MGLEPMEREEEGQETRGRGMGEAHAGPCALLLGLRIYSEKMRVMGVFLSQELT